MPVSDLLLSLMGDKDPTQQLLAAMQQGGGTPPATATPPAPMATPDAAPGAGGTGAPATPPQPQAYQSPPDLVNLYNKLIERQQRSQVMDQGLALMASGVAQPENRDRVYNSIAGAPGHSGATASSTNPISTIEGLMKLNAAQTALAEKAAHRATLPSIAKQYGMDLNTATYLFDNNKLDGVLSELLKPNKQMTELANGQHAIVDLSSGHVSDPFGPTKPKELEIKQDPNGQFVAFDKTTGLPVGSPQGVVKGRELEFKQDGNGQIVAFDKSTGQQVGVAQGAATPHKFEAKNDANGNLLPFDSATGTVGAPLAPGMGATENEQLWRADEADRKSRGVASRSLSDFITQTGRSRAGGSNLGPKGIDVGPPPKDMAWLRNDDGSVRMDDKERPMATPVAGGPMDVKQAAAADQKDKREGQKALTTGLVSRSIDDIFAKMDANRDSWTTPITGLGGSIAEMIPGTEAGNVSGLLDTVKSNIGFEKLQQMRENSPTGGALGQVSDFENRLLQSTFGDLSQKRDSEQFVKNLMRVRYLSSAIVHKGVKNQAEADALFDEADAAAKEFNNRKTGAPAKDAPIDDIVKHYTKAK